MFYEGENAFCLLIVPLRIQIMCFKHNICLFSPHGTSKTKGRNGNSSSEHGWIDGVVHLLRPKDENLVFKSPMLFV